MDRIAKKLFDLKRLSYINVRMYLNHEEARMELQEEIKKIAQEEGYDVKKVFTILNKAEKYGDEKRDGKVMIALAKEVAAIVGMTKKLPSARGPNELPATDSEPPGRDSAFDKILQRQSEKVVE